MKTVCIYHSVDLDGWMSAAIIKHWFNKSKVGQLGTFKDDPDIVIKPFDTLSFIGYNYDMPIPDLSEYDQIIMCDISFPIEEMEKLRQIFQERFVWLDHHISIIRETENRTNSFYEGKRDVTKAACEITWEYFFPHQQMPEIVRLLGRYDCFGHKGTKEELMILEFQYGARQCISNHEDAYKYLTIELQNDTTDELKDVICSIWLSGQSIYKYLCTEARQSYQNGFVVEFTEELPTLELIQRRFICVNKERFNAINFGIDYHKDGYDGLASFHYSGTCWKFSIYNDNGLVDCSVIATQFGGGGHKGASGFILNSLTQIGIK